MIREEKDKPFGHDHINGSEGFWSFAKNRLYQYRSVPANFFHLYLAEVYQRFNHCNEDHESLLRKLLQTPTITDVKPILVRKAWEITFGLLKLSEQVTV